MKFLRKLLLALTLTVLLAVCVSAADETLPFTYVEENGEITLTAYTGEPNTTVVIPDEIDGLPVTTFGTKLFKDVTGLEINIPKYLRHIDPYAFSGTGVDLTLPATVTEFEPDSLTGVTSVTCPRYSEAARFAKIFGIWVYYDGEVPNTYEFQEGAYTFWITDGEATLVHIVTEQTDLIVIPETADGCPVTRIARFASELGKNIPAPLTNHVHAVVVPGCVKEVGSYSLRFTNLRSVYFAEGVETIGDYAFSSIASISVTLPDSLRSIGQTYPSLEDQPKTIYAAEGSVGQAFAESINAIFVPNVDEQGRRNGDYGSLKFYIENDCAVIYDSRSPYWDLYLPAYIDQWPVTRICDYALMGYCPYVVLPPTITELGKNIFGDLREDSPVLLYYPGCEDVVAGQPYEKMMIYEALELPFSDVPTNEWYYGAVSFAYYNGLMNGTSAVTFEPETTMTRAMLVTVLWRIDGAEEQSGKSAYLDVPEGEWYTEAVIWASDRGIVNGVGGNRFDPEGTVTREQIATILCRYLESYGVETSASTSLDKFVDGGAVSDYACGAMQWAVENGLIGGRKDNGVTRLAPQDGGTRAEISTILMRFLT